MGDGLSIVFKTAREICARLPHMERRPILLSLYARCKRYMFSGIGVLTLLVVITGCAGPWKGRILDAETKEPLEGTVVLAVWQRVYRTPAGGNSYFYEAKESVTNKSGEFEIPSYTPINLLPLISYIRGPEFTIFKPGYGSLNGLALAGFFTEEKSEEQYYELRGAKYKFASGVIELPLLRTWEARNSANMISPYSDIPQAKWPLLKKLLDKEKEWLKNNKGWRM
jgi:hypothetical protein